MPRPPVRPADRRFLPTLAAALALAAFATSCGREARYRTMTVLFEDVPPPSIEAAPEPVVRPPRRPAPPEPEPDPLATPPMAASASLEPLETWDDVVRVVPKDQNGNPDWTAALEERVVAPRSKIDDDANAAEAAAPDAASPEAVAKAVAEAASAPPPRDLELASASDRAFDVQFSHRKHGNWLSCENCHPAPFAEGSAAATRKPGESHDAKHCASCHGKVSFDIGTGCLTCHLRTMPRDADGQVDWTRALESQRIAPRPGISPQAAHKEVTQLLVEMVPPSQPALKVVFSHATHTPWVACASCHPEPYSAKTRLAMGDTTELHSERYCGSCHGTVAFDITGSCERCHPSLHKARQHQEALDLDVPVTPRSGNGGATTLSHRQHRWVECATCHKDIFSSTPGATTMPKSDIYGGKYCGTCHGQVAADLMTTCRRCHPSEVAP